MNLKKLFNLIIRYRTVKRQRRRVQMQTVSASCLQYMFWPIIGKYLLLLKRRVWKNEERNLLISMSNDLQDYPATIYKEALPDYRWSFF